MKNCKFFPFLLSLLFIFTLLPLPAHSTTDVWSGGCSNSFAGGTGEETDPYQISTPEQLAYLASRVNEGETFFGVYFVLTNDIKLNETPITNSSIIFNPPVQWTPIGISAESCFSGNFSGNSYAIDGLYMADTDKCAGLFGYVDGGTIQNLYLTGVYIHSTNRASGISSQITYGSIFQCTVDGVISGAEDVGGIAGYSYETTISCCINNATISGSGSLGGIVGRCNRNETTPSKILYCLNTGVVTGNGFSAGVAGSSWNTEFEWCTNFADINNSYHFTSGICASATSSTFSDCHNYGNISGEYYSGGICGSMQDSRIYNSFNIASVSGNERIGGIVGENNHGIISNCYNAGTIMSVGDSCGGIVGQNNGSGGIVQNCVHTGDITPAKNANSYRTGIGVIAGWNSNGVVDHCAWGLGQNLYLNPGNTGQETEVRSLILADNIAFISSTPAYAWLNSNIEAFAIEGIDTSSWHQWTSCGSPSYVEFITPKINFLSCPDSGSALPLLTPPYFTIVNTYDRPLDIVVIAAYYSKDSQLISVETTTSLTVSAKQTATIHFPNFPVGASTTVYIYSADDYSPLSSPLSFSVPATSP